MKAKIFLPLQLALIFAIAIVSKYEIPNLDDASWDTVLFLSPYGIIRNLSDESSVLRSFYGDISSGQVELSGLQLGLMGVIYIGLLANSVRFIKRARAEK